MSSVLPEPIRCAVCLCDFTDPQILPCEHSFCKMCILGHMQAWWCTGTFCPECRQQFTEADLRPNTHLRDIQVHLKEETSTADRGHHDKAGFCMEHDEKLKLFCETDQTLVCVICRDGDKHKGHKFKPVIEIEKIKKEEVRTALEILTLEGKILSDLADEQRAEIQKSKTKADFLSAQISAQFEEMHQFLRQKEEELKKKLKMEEKRNLQPMEERIAMIETLLREEDRKLNILKSALGIPQPEMFIQWWNDKGLHVMESVQKKAW
ncbi:nuclear factor 7, brain-like [Trichomycterus rosablanca]|uniref:nuclear factor 7, brain-like n=1 Tax=Trichomycterus rosablanca TaxID=2290929 RepID=UPI002F3506CB